MKAPHQEALLKALEQIIEVADASLAAATGTQPIRPVQLAVILVQGHEHIRSLARAARGDRRWGRRPSLTPLPPKDDERPDTFIDSPTHGYAMPKEKA